MYIAGNDNGGLESVLCSIPDRWHAQYFQWTTSPPEQEGWYWLNPNWRDGMIIVEVYKDHHGVLMIRGEEYDSDIKDNGDWLGPLPIPEPPKK